MEAEAKRVAIEDMVWVEEVCDRLKKEAELRCKGDGKWAGEGGGGDGGPPKCRFYNFLAYGIHPTSTILVKSTYATNQENLQATTNLHGNLQWY